MDDGKRRAGTRLGRYGAALLIIQLAACAPDAPRSDAPSGADAATGGPAASTPARDERLVVAFGDSLYAGYGLPNGQGFAPALERALAARGMTVRVFNAGVSGDTSADGARRIAFVLDGQARRPDLVVVGLGGNDMLRGLSPAATRASLDAVLAEVARRGIPILLTGMRASPNMGPAYAAAFDPIFPELSRKYGAPLDPFILDGVVGRRELLLPDGIHPNARGVAVVTSRVAPIAARALAARR